MHAMQMRWLYEQQQRTTNTTRWQTTALQQRLSNGIELRQPYKKTKKNAREYLDIFLFFILNSHFQGVTWHNEKQENYAIPRTTYMHAQKYAFMFTVSGHWNGKERGKYMFKVVEKQIRFWYFNAECGEVPKYGVKLSEYRIWKCTVMRGLQGHI